VLRASSTARAPDSSLAPIDVEPNGSYLLRRAGSLFACGTTTDGAMS
jgi:hypothetical protein